MLNIYLYSSSSTTLRPLVHYKPKNKEPSQIWPINWVNSREIFIPNLTPKVSVCVCVCVCVCEREREREREYACWWMHPMESPTSILELQVRMPLR